MARFSMPPIRLIRTTAVLLTFEGLGCLALLLAVPSDPGNAILFGFSSLRLVLLGLILLGILVSGILVVSLFNRAARSFHYKAEAERLALSRPAFIVTLFAFSLSLLLVLHRNITPLMYQAIMERLLPLVLYTFLISGHILLLQFLAGDKTWKRNTFLLIVTPALVFFYWNTANYFSALNYDWKTSDQQNFIEFALEARASNYVFTGGRNYMPLYPFLLAPFMDISQGILENFGYGKLLNISLSLGMALLLFFIFRAYLPKMQAYLLILLVAFSLFIYKAPYTQPELLFYLLFFIAFLLSCRLIIHPKWAEAILLGLVLAAAQMTKASILPFLALLIATIAAMALGSFIQRSQKKAKSEIFNFKPARVYLGSIALVTLFFFSAIWPYISESKAQYGSYFYNVNTTFYAWYDSWREAKDGTRAHGDNIGWPDLPPDQIPSPTRYLQTHSAEQIAARLWRGMENQASNLWNTFSLISYPLLLVALLALSWAAEGHQAGVLWRMYYPLIIFVALLWGGYLLAYAWYSPIVDYADQRFTYSLVIPMLFASFMGLQKLLNNDRVYSILGQSTSAKVWHERALSSVALILALDILIWVPVKMSQLAWYGK